MYVCAADLEADSAEPLTRSFQAVVEATSFEKPGVRPMDFPVVEGSEMVDIHNWEVDDVDDDDDERKAWWWCRLERSCPPTLGR
jgi:hypothetical protein